MMQKRADHSEGKANDQQTPAGSNEAGTADRGGRGIQRSSNPQAGLKLVIHRKDGRIFCVPTRERRAAIVAVNTQMMVELQIPWPWILWFLIAR
jgi:hypothetical protein